MKIKIIGDSASNLYNLSGVDYECAPLKIITDAKEYVDNVQLDLQGMIDDLRTYEGKSGTACPSVGDYLAAFEGYDIVYVVTIISTLSGSYNAACQAAETYMEENPGKIEDIYSTMLVFAGYEIVQEYLHSHIDFTRRILPGVDFSSNEAKRAELMKQEDPLFSILERFFASVVSDYNGKVFSLSDGEFLKKLKPFHATNYGTGSYNALFEVLDPDSFFLVLVDAENGYTEKTPAFHMIAAGNQEFTQPVDFQKTYILGFVFRGVGGAPFLMYETKDQKSSGNDYNLALRILSEEERSALQVPGKIGVWTG